ncbi:MAG: hypothetical protein LBI78_02430 [Campylobacteraceae bacterium]|jgi:hypothetical protein|nr:hypothetical protein [Campylobacteraceae bacterium]
MKSAIKLSLVLILTLFLSSCKEGKSNNDDNNPTVEHPYSYGYDCKGNVAVNGYALPPCPDPKINDETLLGIDVNNNGVRDDVERWLIARYKNDHKIVTEIGFQASKAHQFMLANPDKPEEARQAINGAQACNWYFKYDADEFGDPILIDHSISTSIAFDTIQLNTEERIRAYLAYDRKLGGEIYRLPRADEEKALCTFDVDTLLGD